MRENRRRDIRVVKVKTGVRQGCILSPCLFNVALDHILRKVEAGNIDRGISIRDKAVWDLEYADDTTLLAISLSTLVEMMKAFGEESEKL